MSDTDKPKQPAQGRKEYTLKLPVMQRSTELLPGTKVLLRQDQADKLKASGHI